MEKFTRNLFNGHGPPFIFNQFQFGTKYKLISRALAGLWKSFLTIEMAISFVQDPSENLKVTVQNRNVLKC